MNATDTSVTGGADRAGRILRGIALALLVSCAAARCFLAEDPYRTSVVPPPLLAGETPAANDQPQPTDTTELARVTFAVLLLAALAAWALAGAAGGQLVVRHAWLAGLILLFALFSLPAAWAASNQREAANVWLEQVSLLAAVFLAAQLCDRSDPAGRRRFALAVVVLAGIAAALAVKGFYQAAIEIPQSAADFDMYRDERLAHIGLLDGSPEARLFEARLRSLRPAGFFSSHSNLFASVLLVLLGAAGGLAADKLGAAVRDRRNTAGARRRGDIHLPTLAAALTVAAAGAVAAVLVLTHSRGGIVAGAAAAVAAGLIARFRRRLAKRWKTCVLAASGAIVLCVAGVVGYGLTRDRLPSRTMTFRWYYWTASMEIVRRRPLLGAGPGNFPAAYLRHRRAEAEEAVKMPHNVAVRVLAEYGLPGGLCYMAIVAGVMVGLCRASPSGGPAPPHGDVPPRAARRGAILTLASVVLVVPAARYFFAGASAGGAMFFLEGIAPGVILATMLAVAFWTASPGAAPATDLSRIALACGAAGMLLHNMVTFSLSAPGAALVFWLAAGAALGQAGAGRCVRLKLARLPIALAASAAAMGAVVVVWQPVFLRSARIDGAIAALRAGRPAAAALLAERAALADPLDPLAAGDAARIAAAAGQNDLAVRWARQAVRRDPADGTWKHFAASLLWESAPARRPDPRRTEALALMARAVQQNPMGLRGRLAYARMLADAGQNAECLAQLRAAEDIDRRLNPDSLYRLSPDERREIESLKAAVRQTPNGASPPASGRTLVRIYGPGFSR